MPVLNPQALVDNRVEAIREFHRQAGTSKAEIDVSGGVDSAVIVCLLSMALGPENVIAVHSQINSDPDALERAREVCTVAGVKLAEIDLTPVYEQLVDQMKAAFVDAHITDPEQPGDRVMWEKLLGIRLQEDPSILGSIRSTLRAPVGRGFNRLAGGGIRHGTGNECEDRFTRFFQKGGDGEVDCNAIAMLSKAEVFQLARQIGVPKPIINAVPSPDLWGNGDAHNDEDEYASYFGFRASDYGQTFYGYIDPETGEYTKVGLIERVSRFADSEAEDFGVGLFVLGDDYVPDLIRGALVSDAFKGVDPRVVDLIIPAARIIERKTRHKWNPNCPSLGDRESLIKAGILTNKLPRL